MKCTVCGAGMLCFKCGAGMKCDGCGTENREDFDIVMLDYERRRNMNLYCFCKECKKHNDKIRKNLVKKQKEVDKECL